jgi:hypothetical protein
MDLRPGGEIPFQADNLAPSQAGVTDRDDHDEIVVAVGEERGAFGEQQGLCRGGPGSLRGAFEAATGAAAAVARAESWVVRDERWLGGGRVAQDRVQQAAGVEGGAAGDLRRGGQPVLPFGDLFGAERVQRLVAPRRADEPADQVLTVGFGADADVLQGQPALDPFADGDVARVRVGPAALADRGLLVASPVERGGLGLEPGLTGFQAAGQLVLDPPGGRAARASRRMPRWLLVRSPGVLAGGCALRARVP